MFLDLWFNDRGLLDPWFNDRGFLRLGLWFGRRLLIFLCLPRCRNKRRWLWGYAILRNNLTCGI